MKFNITFSKKSNMTNPLSYFSYLYNKFFSEPVKMKPIYGKRKPIVLSLDTGEINQKDIDKMIAAWEENKIEPSKETEKFWESCQFSLNESGEISLYYNKITGYKSFTSHPPISIPKTLMLMELAKRWLTELNIPFSDQDCVIEFHHSKVSVDGVVVPKFNWHIDDGGAVNYNSIAVLFYVHKDPRMIGGNLFWNPNGEHEDGKKLINLKTGSVVIMYGNIAHCPETVQHGFTFDSDEPQERKLIVFFFRDTTRLRE